MCAKLSDAGPVLRAQAGAKGSIKRVNFPGATNHGPLHYLFSCGLLLLPALIWNIAFFHRLPPAFATSEFWRDIPAPLAFIENSLRAIVFGLPFAMPLSTSTPARRWSLFIFGLGSLVYFSSWLALIVSPDSRWSTSALGFMAPAYTPALWLFGLATLGRRLFWGRFYRWWMYAVVSIGLLIAHTAHTALVYARTQ